MPDFDSPDPNVPDPLAPGHDAPRADAPADRTALPSPVILASTSPIRRSLLDDAGIVARAIAPGVDEAAIKRAHAAEPVTPDGTDRLALALADAKAAAVARLHPDALVIGADQILRMNETRFDKPASAAQARAHLQALQGHAHHLHTAIVLHRGHRVLWRHVETPRLVMRALPPAFLDGYCAREEDALCTTVGAYRIEGPGIQLFETVEGDHAAILGLPLLKLLAALRHLGHLD